MKVLNNVREEGEPGYRLGLYIYTFVILTWLDLCFEFTSQSLCTHDKIYKTCYLSWNKSYKPKYRTWKTRSKGKSQRGDSCAPTQYVVIPMERENGWHKVSTSFWNGDNIIRNLNKNHLVDVLPQKQQIYMIITPLRRKKFELDYIQLISETKRSINMKESLKKL